MSTDTLAPKLSRDDKLTLIEQLTIALEEKEHRDILSMPATHGFPEFLSSDLVNAQDGETELQLIARQESAIYTFAKDCLFLVEDGRKVPIILLPEAKKLVADFFYGRTQKGILWKCGHPDNKVITSDGLKRIADVTTSDFVVNEAGATQQVLQTGGRHFKGDLVGLTTSGGIEVQRYTPEHKLKIIRRGGMLHPLSAHWVRANVVVVGDVTIAPVTSFGVAGITHNATCIGDYVFSIITGVTREFYDGHVCDIEVDGGLESFCSPYMTVHNSRGGGGSTTAAVLVFLMMLYHKKEFTNLAGCALPGQYVQAGDKFKHIEQVRGGDTVASLQGATTEVTNFIEKHWDGLVTKIRVRGSGIRLEYTSDHKLLCVKNAYPKLKGSKYRCTDYYAPLGAVQWEAIGALSNVDALAIPLPIQSGKLPLLRHGLKTSVEYRYRGKQYRECPITPEHCLFIGYWLAEGHTSEYTVVLSLCNDDEFIDELPHIVKRLFDRNVTPERNLGVNGNEARFVMGDKVFSAWLKATFGAGAFNKTIPLWFLDALPDDHLQQLLIGFIRGDGCYKKNGRGKTVISFGCVSPGIMSALYRICLRLRIFPNINIEKHSKVDKKVFGDIKNRKDMWMIQLYGMDAFNYANLCFPEVQHPKGPARKVPHRFTDSHLLVKIMDKEDSHYTGPVYDITVPNGESFGIPMGHAHNSGAQSRSIYEKVVQFCSCNRGIYRNILDGDPLVIRTLFRNGAKLHCINASDKQVRSLHDSGLVIDEGCLLPGSKVLTTNGIRCVEDTKVGDGVLNEFGVLTKVRKVWSKHWEGNSVKIVPNGWLEGLSLTGDHPVKIFRGMAKGSRTRKRALHSTKPVWALAEEVTADDYTVIPIIQRTEVHNGDCYLYSNNTDFALWLGYWLGDGWTSKGRSRNISVVFNKKDVADIERYRSLAAKLFDRVVIEDNSNAINRKDTVTLRFTHKDLASILDDTFGTSSLSKRIPLDIVLANNELFSINLIRGLLASDGTLWEGTTSTGCVCTRASIQTSSKQLATSIIHILYSLGVAPSFRECNGRVSTIREESFWTSPSTVIDINGAAISMFLGTDNSRRKQKAFNSWERVGNYIAVPIRAVEITHYEGTVWDIAVEGGESFMMPNAIVHNCQDDVAAGAIMKTSLQNALTQPDPIILVLSTFHHPEGFFQEFWDKAEYYGFVHYFWDIFGTMSKCTADMDCTECYLTDRVQVRDEHGKVTGHELSGCNGRARNGVGFRSRDIVISIKQTNEDSSVWPVEYCCERPKFSGLVYNIDALNESLWSEIEWYDNMTIAVGVDWGYVGQTSVAVVAHTTLGIGVLEVGWFHRESLSDIIDYLFEIKNKYGNIFVLPDSENHFNNRELVENGFAVKPVVFKKMKDYGIKNLSKFISTGRFQMLNGAPGIEELNGQMKAYRFGPNGKPIKKNDHGPDAVMSAALMFRYYDMYSDAANLRKTNPEKFTESNRIVKDSEGAIITSSAVASSSGDVLIF